MKTKIFIALIFLVIISSCTKSVKPDYLFLHADQLKRLGIELNENGVFYKNENPVWDQDNEKYACLAFYCTNTNFVTTKHFNLNDTLTVANSFDSLLIEMEFSKNDFYPLLIGNAKRNQSLDNESLPEDIKLIPVAIKMDETNLSNRKDTVVVWLRPTESLKKALPANINMNDFLRSIPVNI